MRITIAENLRKMRRDRNLTQEELAGYLGISFQAVSKWERDEGYPDISMLPVIANFFGITVDALIGNDVTTQEERIRVYCEQYEELNRNGAMEAATAVAQQAYRDYPYHWDVIDIYCLSLTKGYSEHPGEKLAELRSVCQMIMEKCTDAKIRMHAVYSMLFAEEDAYVEKWFAEVPGTYDFTEWERREDRYFERKQMEKYRHQKQQNMRQLYRYLFEKLGAGLSTPQEAVDAYRIRAALQDALFGGENAICEKFSYAFNQMQLASALFESGEKEEGYVALEGAAQNFAEYFAIPEGEALQFVGLFDTLTIQRRQNPEAILPFLVGSRQLKGFQTIAGEERFKMLAEKICNA